MTRMSAAMTLERISVFTPLLSMICFEIWINPSVCESSGDRLRVQLRKRALKSE